jgi:hypothetical protein
MNRITVNTLEYDEIPSRVIRGGSVVLDRMYTHPFIGESSFLPDRGVASLRMGQTLHPAISPKRQVEPFPDHPRQLVLAEGDEPECHIEADGLQGRMHVQYLMPAGVD